jgi:hypothetical protein
VADQIKLNQGDFAAFAELQIPDFENRRSLA